MNEEPSHDIRDALYDRADAVKDAALSYLRPHVAEAKSRLRIARAGLRGQPIISRVSLVGSVDVENAPGLTWDRVKMRPRPMVTFPTPSDHVTFRDSQFGAASSIIQMGLSS